MTRNIDQILRELLEIDPSFAAHEKEVRRLITELLAKKPDTRLDENFVARLRSQLVEAKPVPSPYSAFSYMPYVAGVLAVLLVVPLGFYVVSRDTTTTGDAVFAMNQQIDRLGSGAYGTIAAEAGGKGGGAGAPMATMAAQENMAMGSDAAYADRMIYPAGPITVYNYVYKGEPLELTDSDGLVYNRVKGQNSSGQIASQLRKFNFGLINLGAYSDARIRSFELVEDKPFGYAISVSFEEGMISVNPNYTQWPSMSGKEMASQIPMSAMPSSDEAIAIADRFLKDHGVSVANYGDPVVQDYSHLGVDGSSEMYAPEQVTVTYPLKISGATVYEDGAYPYGLQVGVSVKDKRVMSVYGLSSQTFTGSSYKLETDSDRILSIAARGGVHAWVPENTPGTEIKKVEAELGTPEKVLMHTYTYSNNESKELFVPALSFPVTKAPEGEQYYPKYIVIPLVPELLENDQGPVLYDAVR